MSIYLDFVSFNRDFMRFHNQQDPFIWESNMVCWKVADLARWFSHWNDYGVWGPNHIWLLKGKFHSFVICGDLWCLSNERNPQFQVRCCVQVCTCVNTKLAPMGLMKIWILNTDYFVHRQWALLGIRATRRPRPAPDGTRDSSLTWRGTSMIFQWSNDT